MINYSYKPTEIIFGVYKTNCSSNDCEWRLFNVDSLYIIWSSLQVHYEIFFSLKYLTFFYPWLITLFYLNNFMEIWTLKHGLQN